MSTMFRRLFGLTLCLSLVFSMFASTRSAGASSTTKQLTKRDRELIAQARAEGKDSIKVLIAAQDGRNSAVVSQIEALGGTVEVSNDKIDYVLAEVPLDQAENTPAISGVESLGVDEVLPLEEPRPDGAVAPTPQAPPSAATPQNNPYMPIGDTGAAQFMVDHPTWDGRGVTVGILDSGIDLGHPALSTTTTGERKITDWVTFTSQTADNDPTWLNMNTTVSGASFTYQGATYTAPASGSGSYRISRINERDSRLGGELGNDLNRDGNPAGSNGFFAVLWDKASNNVYVDTNQNNSFADEQAMTDYKVRYDVNAFGTDNPATEIRESVPFVVQTSPATNYVNIGIVSGAHGSHVAGIVAGNGLFGGAMTGAAPGAKLVSIRVCLFISGCTSSALINGMIFAVETAKVDAINMSIGGLPALNAGENNGPANTRAILYNRLIDEGGVQIFISAGNSGGGVNTIGDPSVASKVVSVGSYVTDATLRSNYGSDSAYVDNIHNYSSRGPREDGGLKPNVVAPGAAISTVPTWQAGQPVAGVHTLPAGYGMFNGTSMASPQTAGATALLISAAKQSNVQYAPAQLRQALTSTARYLDKDRFEAYDQGNGLIRVQGAWNMLRKNLKTVNISASVPVNTLLSGFLTTPGYGVGIYDREGVAANTSYVRQFTFKRTSGSASPITYNVKWVGDVSSFVGASKITLPLNQAVTYNVTIKTGAPGTYSTIMNLEDTNTAGIDFQTMNTVIVADKFSAANNYTVTKTGTVGRNQTLHFFYTIPAGTPAFKVNLTGTTGQVRFMRFDPYGLPAEAEQTSSSCYVPAQPGNTCNGATRTVSNPLPGVWELAVDARRTSDAAVSNFTLTASILGASVSPNPDTIASATVNTPVNRSYTLTNLFGTFDGSAAGTNLGSAFKARPTIGNGATQIYSVYVEPGSTSLTARIGNPSDPAADLDLFVRNAAGATVGQSADGDSEEAVTINLPANFAGGTYTIRIDGYAVPSGNTAYDYLDLFANTKFGSVALTDAVATHAAGSSWTVPGVVTVKAAPAAGRSLLGSVLVRTDEGVLVGSGEVLVQSVNP